MLKLNPIKSEKIWGYENWIASVYPSSCHEELVNECGSDYPLLIKVIQADDTLSVQVHPDDKAAFELEGEGFCGKTECWYVLESEPGSKLVSGLKPGFNKDYFKDDLEKAVKDNTLENYLNFVTVQKGDFIFIPSGTVHAIGGGLRLLEVQQSCDLTYRLYDWGRPREVHIEKGLSVIKAETPEPQKPFAGKFKCNYFSLEKIKVDGVFDFECPEGNKSSDWKMIFVLEGSGSVKDDSGLSFDLSKEDIVAFKPGERVSFSGNLSLMIISSF